MAPPDPNKYVLTDEERIGAKEAVGKWLRYLENRRKSAATSDEIPLYTRRRNLSVHLGVDEAVNKKDLQLINVCALPLPATVEARLERSQSLRNKDIEKDIYRERRSSEAFLHFQQFLEGAKDTSSEMKLLEGTEENPKVMLRSPSNDPEAGLKYSETLNTILEDDDSISISSAVSFCSKCDCHGYTCCEKEDCTEEVIEIDQCPRDTTSDKQKIPKENIPDLSFCKIVLKCPHCHLDCLSILPEHKDTLTLARVETAAKIDSIMYSCCDNDQCHEETVCLERCPNNSNWEHSDEDEREYKIKDLPNYLGMKEVVPMSEDNTENKILRKLSNSLKIKKHKDHKK